MRVRLFLMALTLPISLAGCAPDEATAVLTTIRTAPPGTRRAAIKRSLARICPAPMSNDDLERAADFVEQRALDPEAVWVVRRLDRMDIETRICRGVKKESGA